MSINEKSVLTRPICLKCGHVNKGKDQFRKDQWCRKCRRTYMQARRASGKDTWLAMRESKGKRMIQEAQMRLALTALKAMAQDNELAEKALQDIEALVPVITSPEAPEAPEVPEAQEEPNV